MHINKRAIAIATSVSVGMTGIAIGSALLSATIASNKINTENQRRAYVQAACDAAHTNHLAESIRVCAIAQDVTHSEYICEPTDTYCLVEFKGTDTNTQYVHNR